MKSFFEYINYIYQLMLIRMRQDVRNYTFGLIWWFLDPIINTAILYVVTVILLGSRTEDMAMFLLSGLLMYRYLQTAINGAAVSLNRAMVLSNRLYVPKYVFVIRDVAAETYKFLIGVVFIVILTFILGNQNFSLWETLLVCSVAILFALAVAPLVAFASALVADTRVVISYLFRALFFISGTFFSLERVPEDLRSIFLLNPFALLLHEFRLAVLSPDGLDLGWLMSLAAISLLIAIAGFRLLISFDRKLPKYVL